MAEAKDNTEETKTTGAADRAATDAVQGQPASTATIEPAQGEAMVTLVLNTSFVTNGIVHGPGKVTVPESLADDLMRRQEHWDRVEAFRLNGEDFTVEEALAKFDAAGK